MKRSEKDGNQNGMKLDKFRNSRFEMNQSNDGQMFQQQSQSQGMNTLGGKWAENRGHRTADDRMTREHYNNPFENGNLSSWSQRQGMDEYYDQRTRRPGRQGGAILNADEQNHHGRGPKGYSRSDERVLEDVNEMLYASPDVDASDIEVKVKDGIVYFSGTIESREMKKMAELEVENVSGVRDIQNALVVKRAS